MKKQSVVNVNVQFESDENEDFRDDEFTIEILTDDTRVYM